MMKNKFSIKIANDTVREKVFAEISYNEEEWAEISQEGEHPLLTIFPPLQGKYWEFPLDEAIQTLKWVKDELINS